MKTAINLNEQVTVELTEFGKKVWRDHYTKLNLPAHWWELMAKDGQLDLSKPLRLSLWELMQIFGPSMSIGMHEVPFKENVFVVEVEEPKGVREMIRDFCAT
jgi:hypothetical protein